ncbi:cytochrome c oxidase assembly protein [Rhizobium halophytocola]|uniref:Cytochrome c oxidase assembly protein CtaG n=1 Tax=Rhizobium halophytocola TaxID=735519 RepID=A0ABS4DXF8_9HYPH|nr:cytochrome c oxidase assembly protein [Rhizobium halophytocola]MBP1850309.1 cytochrome c oxidase assembly protein subunit 11 [Rhizobium halophytocola]
MTGQNERERRSARRNGAVLVACVAFVGGMVGMSYAAVPLYRMFCQVTGFNGTTQRAEQGSDVILDRKITVTFDSNVSPGLNWAFKPMQHAVNPKIGETVKIKYLATNRSPRPVTGQAVFNVTPLEAAAYFNKIECFCFTETTLKPGESLEMPVVFYVDPEITTAPETKGINTLTLSYTFYPREPAEPVAALPDKADEARRKL